VSFHAADGTESRAPLLDDTGGASRTCRGRSPRPSSCLEAGPPADDLQTAPPTNAVRAALRARVEGGLCRKARPIFCPSTFPLRGGARREAPRAVPGITRRLVAHPEARRGPGLRAGAMRGGLKRGGRPGWLGPGPGAGAERGASGPGAPISISPDGHQRAPAPECIGEKTRGLGGRADWRGPLRVADQASRDRRERVEAGSPLARSGSSGVSPAGVRRQGASTSRNRGSSLLRDLRNPRSQTAVERLQREHAIHRGGEERGSGRRGVEKQGEPRTIQVWAAPGGESNRLERPSSTSHLSNQVIAAPDTFPSGCPEDTVVPHAGDEENAPERSGRARYAGAPEWDSPDQEVHPRRG
jgi:hypothetical protein